MPWVLAKDEASKPRLDTVMHHLAESIRIISVLINPFIHNTSEKIRVQLGISDEAVEWADTEKFDLMQGKHVVKGEAIFPRLDIEKELAELEAMTAEQIAKAKEKAEHDAGVKKDDVAEAEENAEISIDDFDKVELRVGEIVDCRKHPNADKLLVSQVKIGDEVRQIVSGVAQWYTPDDMIGKKVVVVANLKPVKLRGEMSSGMLLFADSEDGLKFVTTDAPSGGRVK